MNGGSQEKWITSGASRLKARQSKGFIFRAKQRAATTISSHSVVAKTRTATKEGRQKQIKRRRIIVGKEAKLNDSIEPCNHSITHGYDNVFQSDLSQSSKCIQFSPTYIQPTLNQIPIHSSTQDEFPVQQQFCEEYTVFSNKAIDYSSSALDSSVLEMSPFSTSQSTFYPCRYINPVSDVNIMNENHFKGSYIGRKSFFPDASPPDLSFDEIKTGTRYPALPPHFDHGLHALQSSLRSESNALPHQNHLSHANYLLAPQQTLDYALDRHDSDIFGTNELTGHEMLAPLHPMANYSQMTMEKTYTNLLNNHFPEDNSFNQVFFPYFQPLFGPSSNYCQHDTPLHLSDGYNAVTTDPQETFIVDSHDDRQVKSYESHDDEEPPKLRSPIRFFDSGVEISINGRPLSEMSGLTASDTSQIFQHLIKEKSLT